MMYSGTTLTMVIIALDGLFHLDGAGIHGVTLDGVGIIPEHIGDGTHGDTPDGIHGVIQVGILGEIQVGVMALTGMDTTMVTIMAIGMDIMMEVFTMAIMQVMIMDHIEVTIILDRDKVLDPMYETDML
jgi:hypothetical protein